MRISLLLHQVWGSFPCAQRKTVSCPAAQACLQRAGKHGPCEGPCLSACPQNWLLCALQPLAGGHLSAHLCCEWLPDSQTIAALPALKPPASRVASAHSISQCPVPTASQRRYDLHHAILLHGGYTAASELLGRPPAWPPHRHLKRCAGLRAGAALVQASSATARGALRGLLCCPPNARVFPSRFDVVPTLKEAVPCSLLLSARPPSA